MILSGHTQITREDSGGQLHKVGERGPGEFVGEAELASGRRRDANVVALQGVTCLVFSPGEPTAFAGRGADAQFTTVDGKADIDEPGPPESECIDVSEYVPRNTARSTDSPLIYCQRLRFKRCGAADALAGSVLSYYTPAKISLQYHLIREFVS